jgi:uncharacterized protein YcbK (DUF882 family)
LQLRRLLLLGAVALGVTGFPRGVPGLAPVGLDALGTPSAEARSRTAKRPTKPARGKAAKRASTRSARAERATRARKRSRGPSKVKLCSERRVGKGKRARTRRTCKFVRAFAGHGVGAGDLRKEPLERPSGEVWVYSENLREEARVNIYRPDGAFDEDALARLDEVFRCKRTQEVRALDPRLYEQLSRIQDHFGKVRATVVSGFRFAERSSSRHFHASAIDIKLEGVGLRDMYAYAQSLDGGGMGIGIYPRSGFIHVDYRAPGEPSYRWTDYSPSGSSARAKAKRSRGVGRTARAKRPNA